MKATKLSRKGQVIIPKALRSILHWGPGLELIVIDTGDGLLLKPKAPFAPAELSDVSGMLKGKGSPKTDDKIKAALAEDLRSSLWDGQSSAPTRK
jgi:AbrB family looped-hinge helix DNA binding protein